MVPIGGLRLKIKFLMTFGKKFFTYGTMFISRVNEKLNLTFSILLSGSIVNWQIVTYSKSIGIPMEFRLLGMFLNQIFRF